MSLKINITLSITILIILGIFLIVFVVYPLFSGIIKGSEDLVFQRNILLSLEKKIQKLENTEGIYENYQDNLEKIDNLFINSEALWDFVIFLENTYKECQAQVDIFLSLTSEPEEDQWGFAVFQLHFVGSSSNLFKFLDKLEASPYLIEFQNLNISKISASENCTLNCLNANFSIKVYSK